MHHRGSAYGRSSPLFACVSQGMAPSPLSSQDGETTHTKLLSHLNLLGEPVTVYLLPAKRLQSSAHVACVYVDDLSDPKCQELKGVISGNVQSVSFVIVGLTFARVKVVEALEHIAAPIWQSSSLPAVVRDGSTSPLSPQQLLAERTRSIQLMSQRITAKLQLITANAEKLSVNEPIVSSLHLALDKMDSELTRATGQLKSMCSVQNNMNLLPKCSNLLLKKPPKENRLPINGDTLAQQPDNSGQPLLLWSSMMISLLEHDIYVPWSKSIRVMQMQQWLKRNKLDAATITEKDTVQLDKIGKYLLEILHGVQEKGLDQVLSERKELAEARKRASVQIKELLQLVEFLMSLIKLM